MTKDRRPALRAMLTTDPTDAFTRYALALEHAGHGDLQSAIEELLELRRLDPAYVPAYHQLGILYERAGKPEQARAAYEDGIIAARRSGDEHAAGEMQEALDVLS